MNAKKTKIKYNLEIFVEIYGFCMWQFIVLSLCLWLITRPGPLARQYLFGRMAQAHDLQPGSLGFEAHLWLLRLVTCTSHRLMEKPANHKWTLAKNCDGNAAIDWVIDAILEESVIWNTPTLFLGAFQIAAQTARSRVLIRFWSSCCHSRHSERVT